MRLLPRYRILLSALSGALMVIAFPFTGSLAPLMFVALVPLLLVEHDLFLAKDRPFKILFYAFITFLIYNLGTTYWFLYTKGAAVGTVFIFLISGAAMALNFSLYHWCKRRLGFKLGSACLFAFWLGYEYLHYHWALSYPWLNLGNTFSIFSEVVQWYSITGTLGGTLWILAVNFILFSALVPVLFQHRQLRTQTKLLLFGLALWALPAAVSLAMYAAYKESGTPVEVVVTQPNINTYTQKFNTDERGLIGQLDRFLAQADTLITARTKVVLSPETVISIPFYSDNYAESNTFMHLQKHVDGWNNVALVTGGGTFKFFDHKVRPSMKPVENQNFFYELYDDLILITRNAPPAFVHKSELVLGTEKIPLVEWFPFLEDFAYKTGELTGTIGTEEHPRILQTQGFTFAPVICYESAYGWRTAEQCRNGAEVLFVITNDGWWGDSPGHKQHNALSRLRAVETRRYVARSANTGISSIINERGDIVAATKYDTYAGLRGDVQLNKAVTFYAQHGDYIGSIALFLTALLAGYAALKAIIRTTSPANRASAKGKRKKQR